VLFCVCRTNNKDSASPLWQPSEMETCCGQGQDDASTSNQSAGGLDHYAQPLAQHHCQYTEQGTCNEPVSNNNDHDGHRLADECDVADGDQSYGLSIYTGDLAASSVQSTDVHRY